MSHPLSIRRGMLALLLATLVVLTALGGSANGAGARNAFTLQFVRTMPVDLPDYPDTRVIFDVSRPAQKRTNVYRRVQLVTSCSDGEARLGGQAWVSSSGDPVSIEGAYRGTDCRAWVFDTGGKNVDPFDPDSNVVSFDGAQP